MSLQYIIDNAEEISLDRRKISGQTLTRSGQVRISSLASKVPWRITVKPGSGMNIRTHRAELESITAADRIQIQTINIGSTNTGLSYLTNYLGNASVSQRNAATFVSANILDATLEFPGVSPGVTLFQPGDLISLDSPYKYPYTVTAQVVKGATDQVVVPLSRPFINQSGYTTSGAGLRFGSAVTWNVVVANRPTFTITPGGWIVWNGDFELVEVIED